MIRFSCPWRTPHCATSASAKALTCHISAQENAFHALVAIEMGVHRRNSQIVMIVLEFGEALGQVAFMVIVDILRSMSRTASERLL